MVGWRAQTQTPALGSFENSPDDRAACARLSSRRIVSLSVQALSPPQRVFCGFPDLTSSHCPPTYARLTPRVPEGCPLGDARSLTESGDVLEVPGTPAPLLHAA